jgi:isoleucyl-tRNA synthetase
MDAVRRLATLARAARETVGLRVRQPLAAMRVAVPRDVHGPAFDAFLAILADEVNVKDVRVVASDEELVRLRGKPNYRSLGKVYGKRTPAAAAAVPRLPSDLLQRLEAGQTVEFAGDGEPYRYRAEDVVVEREVASDWLVQSDGPLVVALDPTLSEDLKREGLAREIVNRVQRLRKEAGYDYNTRIELGIAGAAEVVAAATAYRDSIAGETLARRLDVGAELDGADVRETVDLDGRAVVLSLRRHGRGERKRTTPDGTGREAR